MLVGVGKRYRVCPAPTVVGVEELRDLLRRGRFFAIQQLADESLVFATLHEEILTALRYRRRLDFFLQRHRAPVFAPRRHKLGPSGDHGCRRFIVCQWLKGRIEQRHARDAQFGDGRFQFFEHAVFLRRVRQGGRRHQPQTPQHKTNREGASQADGACWEDHAPWVTPPIRKNQQPVDASRHPQDQPHGVEPEDRGSRA